MEAHGGLVPPARAGLRQGKPQKTENSKQPNPACSATHREPHRVCNAGSVSPRPTGRKCLRCCFLLRFALQALAIYKEIHAECPDNVECLRYIVHICGEQKIEADLHQYVMLLRKAEKARQHPLPPSLHPSPAPTLLSFPSVLARARAACLGVQKTRVLTGYTRHTF